MPEDVDWDEIDRQITEDHAEVRDRENNSGCICGWQENFITHGTYMEAHQESSDRFERHVASGDCPEERDEEGNIVL
jgi:hypothetical protein